MSMNIPSAKYLDELGIPYELRFFPPTIQKGAANVAHALGFRERQMVKTLLFETEEGVSVLVMVGGDQSVVSGCLKKLLNSRNIKMSSPDKIKAITGYQVGSIPPFHWQPADFQSYIDASLMEESILGVGAGSWGIEILIKPKDLVKASAASIVNLTERRDH